MRKLLVLSFLLVLGGCEPYPQDSKGTLKEVKKQQVLHVGVIEQKPWSHLEGKEAHGIEAEVISKFAKSIKVEPKWSVHSESEAIDKLKHYKLDVVIGGLTQDSPWKKHVSFTRSYLITGKAKKHKHVMAVPAGENRLLIKLEKFLRKNNELIKQYYLAREDKV